MTNEWLQKHIRIGSLGEYYPEFQFIMEGDTPSFLGLIPNGLGAPEHPEWGGWGGRYILAESSEPVCDYLEMEEGIPARLCSKDAVDCGAEKWDWEYEQTTCCSGKWVVCNTGDTLCSWGVGRPGCLRVLGSRWRRCEL